VSDVRHALASAHARGKRLSEKAIAEVEGAAKKASKAADEARELQLFSEATPNGLKEMQARIDRAEKNAAFWQAQYEKIKKQHFGD
jgi:uncharacterized protein YhaN